METISITPDTLEQEHICCAISDNKDPQVLSKKTWLSHRFADGLVFLKGNVRGKCFIEYIPAEAAWVPVEAPGCMYINCFWVSGQHKGKGWSKILLDQCIADAKSKGKQGLVMLSSTYAPTPKEEKSQVIAPSSKGKRPFLIEPQFLLRRGFHRVDDAEPFFGLYYRPFDKQSDQFDSTDGSALPRFKDCVGRCLENTAGYVLYYTDQCPFTAKYVPLVASIAAARGIPFEVIHLESREAAQHAPCPFTTYSLYYEGRFVTNEILSERKFNRILNDNEIKSADRR